MLLNFCFDSPFGKIILEADEEGLTGLWFSDSKTPIPIQNAPVFDDALRWLDLYFRRKNPGFIPALHLCGTEFQLEVWKLLLEIPYGKTESYGRIAEKIAQARGIRRMSAQAVGGAVGRNPVAVIVPCHRVIGSDGTLTGYAGGLELKRKLLALESL